MCRPAVAPYTIFADLIFGSRVPFSAQDAGCVCLLLWCGVHCSLTSVIYTYCCCCCSRPVIYTGCWLHVSPRCGARAPIFADLISGPRILFSAQDAGCVLPTAR